MRRTADPLDLDDIAGRAIPPVTELHRLAMQLATQAGELILAGRDEAVLDVDTKTSAVDVVTAMDLACERFLRDQLATIRPGDGFYGEEHDPLESETGVRWIVDPIDGTVNYLYGLPDYAVSIGVEVHGVVVTGAVARPRTGDVFHARLGEGAYRNETRLLGSDPADLGMSLVATGFGYGADRRAKQGQVVAGLLPQIRDIRRLGACSLDLCNAAAGTVDAYYEWGLHEWDFAAGALIAAEAGLDVRRPQREDGLLVVAAPSIADDLVAALERLMPEDSL